MRKRIIGILLAIAVLASLIAVLPVNAETPGPLKLVVITPSTVTLPVGGTQQFSAQGQADNHVPIPNLTYTWAVAAGGGTISITGLFTAGNVPGSFPNTVLVAANQGSTVKVGLASVSITPVPGPLNNVAITPGQATLKVGGTKQFSAQGYDASNVPIPNLTYSWSVVAGGGTISITGLFTAGNVGGSFPNTVQVATTQDAITFKMANASVTVETPGPLKQVIITPSTVTLLAGGTQQFSAQGQADNHVPIPNLTYTWAVVAGGGTISSTGLFTAGNVPGSFPNTVLVAVNQGSTVKVDFASVSITPVPGPLDHVAITPGSATLKVSGTKQFSAKGYDVSNVPIPNLTYSWFVAGGGAISITGLFTAGNVPGSFLNTVQVATTQGTITKTATASVTVEPLPTPTPTSAVAKVEGTITGVDTVLKTVTIAPNNGGAAVTIRVTNSTKIEVSGKEHATLADLKVGQRAEAKYEVVPATASALSYNNALKIEAKWLKRWNIDGEITQITGSFPANSAVTITPKKGNQVTLIVTADTKIEVAGKDHATFTDLKVGQRAVAQYEVVPATASAPSYNNALKIEAKGLKQR